MKNLKTVFSALFFLAAVTVSAQKDTEIVSWPNGATLPTQPKFMSAFPMQNVLQVVASSFVLEEATHILP